MVPPTDCIGGDRVMMVSHAFSEPGLRRQIRTVADRIPFRLIVPNRAEVLVFSDFRTPKDDITTAYRRVPLFGSQYLLVSMTLGMRTFRPSIIHIDYDPWAAIFWQVRLAAALFAPQARIVCGAKKNTYRTYPGARGAAKRLLAQLGLKLIDRVAAASAMTASMYMETLDAPPEMLDTVPHVGVDTSMFEPVSPPVRRAPVLRVGYAGRFEPHKGLADLIEAAAILESADGDRISVDLLGTGTLSTQLEHQAGGFRWLTVRDAVPSDQVAAFMQTLDVFVLPSRRLPDHEEHDAHALLQALACGLPTIATRAGIVPEIVREGTGLLVPPGDVPALVGALNQLIEDPELRTRLGRAARNLAVQHYSLDRVADRYEQLYSGVS